MHSHCSPTSLASKITGSDWNSTKRIDWQSFSGRRRELYPDTLVRTETIFVSGQHALTKWTVQATLIEPTSSNSRQKVPKSVHGVSVVLVENLPSHRLAVIFHRVGRILTLKRCY